MKRFTENEHRTLKTAIFVYMRLAANQADKCNGGKICAELKAVLIAPVLDNLCGITCVAAVLDPGKKLVWRL